MIQVGSGEDSNSLLNQACSGLNVIGGMEE